MRPGTSGVEKTSVSLQVGVTCGCELPDVCAGN